MNNKVFITFLMLAFINIIAGSYSFESITVPEYNQVEREEGKPNEIYVKTKDYREYHFSDSNFYIENDTLYGKGAIVVDGIERAFEGKLALSDIQSIQFEYLNGDTTTFLVLGIVAGLYIVTGVLVRNFWHF